jgi:hypothetical protein
MLDVPQRTSRCVPGQMHNLILCPGTWEHSSLEPNLSPTIQLLVLPHILQRAYVPCPWVVRGLDSRDQPGIRQSFLFPTLHDRLKRHQVLGMEGSG